MPRTLIRSSLTLFSLASMLIAIAAYRAAHLIAEADRAYYAEGIELFTNSDVAFPTNPIADPDRLDVFMGSMAPLFLIIGLVFAAVSFTARDSTEETLATVPSASNR